MRSKGSIARALNMSLFAISLPRDTSANSGQQRPEKELISVMDQLYGSLTSIHSKGWNKFVYGEPYIALEIAVPNHTQEIYFYASVPKNYSDIFQKQVHGLFPTAQIEPIEDYSIFHPSGAALGASLMLKENQILPIKTYQTLQTDPLGGILSSLSRIAETQEGAALQVLIRPSHQNDKRSLAEKVVREMQNGYSFKDAVLRAKKPPKEDPNKPQQPRAATPFEQELMKAIQTKASQPLFDVNVRLVVSAESEPRAKQLLDELAGGFVQLSGTNMNSFSVNKYSGRSLQNFLFKFTFRMFDDRAVNLMSSEEITSIDRKSVV